MIKFSTESCLSGLGIVFFAKGPFMDGNQLIFSRELINDIHKPVYLLGRSDTRHLATGREDIAAVLWRYFQTGSNGLLHILPGSGIEQIGVNVADEHRPAPGRRRS